MGGMLCSEREKLALSSPTPFAFSNQIEFTPKTIRVPSFDNTFLEASILLGEVEVIRDTLVRTREKLVMLSRLDDPYTDGAIIQALIKLSSSYQTLMNEKKDSGTEDRSIWSKQFMRSGSSREVFSVKELQEFDAFLRRYKRLLSNEKHLEFLVTKLTKLGMSMNGSEIYLKGQLSESGLTGKDVGTAIRKILANQEGFEAAFDKAENFYCWYLREKLSCENHREIMEHVLKVFDEPTAQAAISLD